jgi:hypothetical protein
MLKNKSAHKNPDFVEIFVKFVTRNGKRVYPKPPYTAFRLLIPKDKYRA